MNREFQQQRNSYFSSETLSALTLSFIMHCMVVVIIIYYGSSSTDYRKLTVIHVGLKNVTLPTSNKLTESKILPVKKQSAPQPVADSEHMQPEQLKQSTLVEIIDPPPVPITIPEKEVESPLTKPETQPVAPVQPKAMKAKVQTIPEKASKPTKISESAKSPEVLRIEKASKNIAGVPPAAAPKIDNVKTGLPSAGTLVHKVHDSVPISSGFSSKDKSVSDETLREDYLAINFGPIRDKVLDNLRYPAIARRQGWEGRIEIEFTISLSGNIENKRVISSSGYPILDRQALRALEISAPFPPPEVAASVVLPVLFTLE